MEHMAWGVCPVKDRIGPLEPNIATLVSYVTRDIQHICKLKYVYIYICMHLHTEKHINHT